MSSPRGGLASAVLAWAALAPAAARADHYEFMDSTEQHVAGGLAPLSPGAARVRSVSVSIRLEERTANVASTYALAVTAPSAQRWAVPLTQPWEFDCVPEEGYECPPEPPRLSPTVAEIPSQLRVTVAGQEAARCELAIPAPPFPPGAPDAPLAGMDGWCVFTLSLPAGDAVPVVLEYAGPLERLDAGDFRPLPTRRDRTLRWNVLPGGGEAEVPAKVEVDAGRFVGLVRVATRGPRDRADSPIPAASWRGAKATVTADGRLLWVRADVDVSPVLDTATLARWPVPVKVRATASSVLAPQAGNRYGPEQAIDGDPATAWCEGAPGDGVGQWLELRLPPFAADRCVALGWAILPGYAKSAATWTGNARVKRFSLARCDVGIGYGAHEVPPVARPPADGADRGVVLVSLVHRIDLRWGGDPLLYPEEVAQRGACVRLTILETIPGTHADACISEVRPILDCAE